MIYSSALLFEAHDQASMSNELTETPGTSSGTICVFSYLGTNAPVMSKSRLRSFLGRVAESGALVSGTLPHLGQRIVKMTPLHNGSVTEVYESLRSPVGHEFKRCFPPSSKTVLLSNN